MAIKRIGVLTGGGDCPGLNCVLRAVVKCSVDKYGYEVIGFKDGYKGLVCNNYTRLLLDDVSGILDKGGTIIGTSNRHNPFNFKVVSQDKVEYKDVSDRAIKNLEILGIDCLIIIGGDGTLMSARNFAEKGVKVIGIPKTIDNDLNATDTTFGFMTAVATATEAIDRLHSTAEAHNRVMIAEVMGRYAGWLALASSIAGGADVILIPEIPYSMNRIVQKIINRKNMGKRFSIVVIAEGATAIGGSVVVDKIISDSPDPIRLGGAGKSIADDIEHLTGLETRVTVLGHLQRGGSPIPEDRILAQRYGAEAIELINKECFGVMVALHGNKLVPVPLEQAVGKLKTVDPNGELVQMAKNMGVSFGD